MIKRIAALGAVLAVLVGAVLAYAFFKPPEEASGPMEAVPVSVDESTGSDPLQADDDAMIFEIVQDGSQARFIIDEVLNGSPNTVVGVTEQVAGQIAIYVDEPARSTIGTVQVNARTLSTDNAMRNRTLKNRILDTNSYEFVTFTPIEIVGLPESVTLGESFSFQIVGELTVRDVTQPVTFEATVTPTSETQLEGVASATIQYADFGLRIPSVRSVASVEDQVILEIAFTAVAQGT